MRERNKINMYFIISELCLIIFPSTFLFMPITNSDTFCYARYVTVAIGIVFWMSGFLGYGILIYLYLTKMKTRKTQRKCYIFSNSIVSVADIVFVLGILGMITLCLKNVDGLYDFYTESDKSFGGSIKALKNVTGIGKNSKAFSIFDKYGTKTVKTIEDVVGLIGG